MNGHHTTPPGSWLPFPIRVRDDLPEGWVFLDRGDGTLEPFVAFEPEPESEAVDE